MRNSYKIQGDSIIIETNKADVILDLNELGNIPDRTIYVHVTGKYACFKLNHKAIKLHRYLMDETDPSIQIDHINNNPLDNRRSNLRKCNNAQNCRNRTNRSNSKVQYKGVVITESGKFLARIQLDGKRKDLGRYLTAEEAALAYNEAAIEYHGEFALLNKVDKDTK